MPQKPIKRGFKAWVRVDARNGYVSEVDVYAGKVTEKGERGLGKHVDEKLTWALVGQHHLVYYDNYFTSIPLMDITKLPVLVKMYVPSYARLLLQICEILLHFWETLEHNMPLFFDTCIFFVQHNKMQLINNKLTLKQS